MTETKTIDKLIVKDARSLGYSDHKRVAFKAYVGGRDVLSTYASMVKRPPLPYPTEACDARLEKVV